MSAGLSGAFAARGVGPRRRRDDRSPATGSSGCWRCSPAGGWARSRCPAARSCAARTSSCGPRSTNPSALRRRGGPARRAAGRDRGDDDGGRRAGARRGPAPRRRPAEVADLGPGGPGARRLHVRDDRRAAGRAPRPALPARQPGPGRALARGPRGRPRLVHDGDRLVEVGPQRLPRAVALRGGGDDRRRPLRPGDAPRAVERESVDVLCQAPTEYRVLAKRTELRPVPSLRRMVSAGEALNPEVIEAFGARARARHPRRLRPDRDRAADRQPRRRRGPRRLDGPGAARASSCGSSDEILELRTASCPTFFGRYLDGEPFDGEWWPTGDVGRAPTTTATSGTRAATTT